MEAFTEMELDNSSDIVIETPFMDLNESTTNFTNQTKTFSWARYYYMILVAELGLSILSCILLIVVYVMIGEHRTLPGKIVLTISSCFIVTYTLLMAGFITQRYLEFRYCLAIGIVAHTFFIASFFWTNVMSYDIMKTIASMKPGRSQKVQFWKYSIYAWTMTLLVVLPSIIVEFCDSVPAYYKPQFGVKKCWLNGDMGFFMFFDGPAVLTVIANCVFFAITSKAIARVRNTSEILATADRHKVRYHVSMKLVLIMGLVWIPEFLSWYTEIPWMFMLAASLLCLHGVYIFVIFACNRRTLKQVSALICPCSTYKTPDFKKTKQSPSVVTITTTMSGSTTLTD